MLATFIALVKVYHVVKVTKSAVLLCNKRNCVTNHQLYCKSYVFVLENIEIIFKVNKIRN